MAKDDKKKVVEKDTKKKKPFTGGGQRRTKLPRQIDNHENDGRKIKGFKGI